MSAAYSHLAQFYDFLMDEDYQAWTSYLLSLAAEVGCRPQRVLDVGCGTGNITMGLAEHGLQVLGTDISAAMVSYAKQKAAEQGIKPEFLVQDMRKLDLPDKTWELAIAACDAMNYLTTEEDFIQALRSIHGHLQDGALFLFDLNTEVKLREVYGHNSYADMYPDFAFFWDNSYDARAELCRMELTFFVPASAGLYRRVDERHTQKLWRPDKVEEFLDKTGFQLVGCYDFLTMDPPTKDSHRWQFAAIKKALQE